MARSETTRDAAVADPRFAPPQPAAGMVLDPKVLDRLSTPGARIGVITAPAGYGKTAHAAAWTADDDRPAAWIDLEDHHNDASLLLDDLVAALRGVTDFEPAGLPRVGVTRDQYATSVSAALGRAVRACTAEFTMVLDDMHHLSDTSSTDLISSLVANVPTGSIVVLIGRWCPLVELSRLRVESPIVEIGTADLALDTAAVAALLGSMGVDVTAERAQEIATGTEGWPVGVRLAGLAALSDSASPHDAPPLLTGREATVEGYLASEWLGDLSVDERSALTRLSALERMSGPLCNAVLDRRDAGELLHHLAQSHLLLIPLDRRGDAYRMHSLLREALRAELDRTDPEALRLVNETASRWFEAAGDIDGAVRHAATAGDLARVERLIVDAMPTLYANGMYSTLDRWIRLLPRDRVERSPSLCLCAALTEFGLGRPERCVAWIRIGAHAAETTRDPDPVALLCLADLRSTTSLGPVRPALADAVAAHEGLPPGIWHAGACLARGAWSWTAGGDDADGILAEGATEADVLGAPVLEAHCTAMRAMIAYTEGDRTRAWQHVSRARRIVSDHAIEYIPGMAIVNSMAALAAASTGLPDEARQQWRLARSKLAALKDLSGWLNVQCRVALAHAAVLLGDRIGAETLLGETRDFLTRQPDATRALDQVAKLDGLVGNLRRHAASGSSALTTAELRVLHYLPTNLTIAEIGARLYLSRYTVKTHCASIYRKLEVNSRSEAVDGARRIGLLGADERADLG